MSTDTSSITADLSISSLQTTIPTHLLEAKEAISTEAIAPLIKPAKRKLTIKQEQFANNILTSRNATDAYVKTYNNKSIDSVHQSAHVLINRQDIRDRALELLQSNPQTQLDNVLKHVGSHLAANKEVIYNSKGDTKEIADNAARGAAQEKLLRLYGLMNKDSDGESITINTFQADPVKLERLAAELNRLNNELGIKDLPDGEVIDTTATGEVLPVHRTETTTQVNITLDEGGASSEEIGGGVGVCVGEGFSHTAIEIPEKPFSPKTPQQQYLLAKMRDKMKRVSKV